MDHINKPESGQLTVTGRDSIEIDLRGMPAPSPCDHRPHHEHEQHEYHEHDDDKHSPNDKLEWRINRSMRGKCKLTISWRVYSLREILWSISY
jgi:hypothetical protein